jgi:serine/threonine protein kinase
MSDRPDFTGQVLESRFQVSEKIGEGGMAVVYRATDTETGDAVAVKIIHPELLTDRTAMARLRREAQYGANFAHPNVCHIIRFGETDAGVGYVVMPFLDGEMLMERTWRDGPMPLQATAAMVRDVCAGLHVAHEQGIIHRDLKPENIMLVKNGDGSERAVVLDFGLATAPELDAGRTKLTKAGMVVGTADFMSPEQMRDKPVDRRSDIYSLAFLTYEVLTGTLPFKGETPRQFAVARMKGESIPLRVARPDLGFPAAVEKVLAKALMVTPAERYQAAPEFARAFTRAAGQPAHGGSVFGWLRRRLG